MIVLWSVYLLVIPWSVGPFVSPLFVQLEYRLVSRPVGVFVHPFCRFVLGQSVLWLVNLLVFLLISQLVCSLVGQSPSLLVDSSVP